MSGGLDVLYGLLPDAIESGVVEIPKKGYYARTYVDDDKNVREKDINKEANPPEHLQINMYLHHWYTP